MQSLQNSVQQRPVMSVEEFIQLVAWPGVQPSPSGGGEASIAWEPQPEVEDGIIIPKPTPPEPFTFEADTVIAQEDVASPEPFPQAEPSPSPSCLTSLPLRTYHLHRCWI